MRWQVPFVGLLLATSPADARTWHITPDGTGDAPTIQAGIDSAAVSDVVLVAAGTYYEYDITMKSGITLRGDGPADAVTIDAQGQGVVLSCVGADDTATIEGLTLTAGQGGLYCESSLLNVSGCIFRENSASSFEGGGLACRSSSVNVSDCIFRENSGLWAGGGMAATGGFATVSDCLFVNNSTWTPFWWEDSFGGGLDCGDGTITNCEFESNYADWGGGLSCGSATVTDCVFADNTAGAGGGLAVPWYSSATVTGCLFYGNMARPRDHGGQPGNGGAIVVRAGASVLVEGCTLVGNSADHAGGGIHNAGTATLQNTIVGFSTAGVAVHSEPGGVTLTCCNVFGNSGGDWVGGISGQGWANGNISAWPLFCDPVNRDYHLSAGSPCLPENSGCAVPIGAFGLGCGPVAVEKESWSRIKAWHR